MLDLKQIHLSKILYLWLYNAFSTILLYNKIVDGQIKAWIEIPLKCCGGCMQVTLQTLHS